MKPAAKAAILDLPRSRAALAQERAPVRTSLRPHRPLF